MQTDNDTDTELVSTDIGSSQHVEGISASSTIDIKETGHQVNISQLYFDKLCYVYDCLWYTSLGPTILGVLICSCAEMFAKLRTINMFLHRSLVAVCLGLIGVDVAYAFGTVPELAVTCVIGANFGIMSILLLINLALFVSVGIPLLMAWDVGLVFNIGNVNLGACSNTFFEVTKGQQLQYVNTDLRTYIFAAQLSSETKIKVMFYTTQWQNNYQRRATIFQPIILWIGFAAAFVARMIFDAPVGFEWIYMFVCWFVLAIVYVVLLIVFTISWCLINTLLCCLPHFAHQRVREWVHRTVVAHMGEKSAPRLAYG